MSNDSTPVPQEQRPLVTVVMPTYNRSHFLTLALDSVLQQTYPHIEIYVVDDGSTDDTREVIARYGDKVHYLSQANSGHSAARNYAIRESKGTYVAFIDDDDLWLPERIAKDVAYLEAYPSRAFVFSRFYYIDLEGHRTKERVVCIDDQPSFAGLYRTNIIYSNSLVTARRRCLEEVGGFDEDLGQSSDYDLWLRMARRHPIGFIDEPLSCYRRHAGNLSKNMERRIVTHHRIFAKPELTEGRSWQELCRRRARTYFEVGDQYYDGGVYGWAAWSWLRAIVAWPFIGTIFWPLYLTRLRFTWGIRLLRPYWLIPWSFLLWLLSLCGLVQRKTMS